VPLKVEGVVNRTAHAEEALSRARRLEPLQLALASSHYLMRIVRPVIFPKPLLMPTAQSETSEGGAVGAQLVADQQFRHETSPRRGGRERACEEPRQVEGPGQS
jgi:hypothetical protein